MMIFFVCHQREVSSNAAKTISALLAEAENAVVIWTQNTVKDNWQAIVKEKIEQADFILFLLDNTATNNPNILWEFECAQKLKKTMFGIKLPGCKDVPQLKNSRLMIFDNISQCLKYAQRIYEENRMLRIEQYKIMIDSTRDVIEQRLKVHHIFFTACVSIISVGFVVGSTIGFSSIGLWASFLFTLLSFVITFFWETMVRSYGTLNAGKFSVLNQLEESLRTNMLDDEWMILTKTKGYKSNTETELKVIKIFRCFIAALLIFEISVSICSFMIR